MNITTSKERNFLPRNCKKWKICVTCSDYKLKGEIKCFYIIKWTLSNFCYFLLIFIDAAPIWRKNNCNINNNIGRVYFNITQRNPPITHITGLLAYHLNLWHIFQKANFSLMIFIQIPNISSFKDMKCHSLYRKK